MPQNLVTDTPTRLAAELGRLTRNQAVWQTLSTESPGLSTFAVEILAVIEAHQPVRASRVAEEFAVSRPVVSRHIAPLVRDGLIESVPDPADGRAALLSLSPEGSAQLERHLAYRRDVFARLFADWSPEERDAFARLLGRLNDAAAALPKPNRPEGRLA